MCCASATMVPISDRTLSAGRAESGVQPRQWVACCRHRAGPDSDELPRERRIRLVRDHQADLAGCRKPQRNRGVHVIPSSAVARVVNHSRPRCPGRSVLNDRYDARTPGAETTATELNPASLHVGRSAVAQLDRDLDERHVLEMPAPARILTRPGYDATAGNASRPALLRSTRRVNLVAAVQLDCETVPRQPETSPARAGKARSGSRRSPHILQPGGTTAPPSCWTWRICILPSHLLSNRRRQLEDQRCR